MARLDTVNNAKLIERSRNEISTNWGAGCSNTQKKITTQKKFYLNSLPSTLRCKDDQQVAIEIFHIPVSLLLYRETSSVNTTRRDSAWKRNLDSRPQYKLKAFSGCTSVQFLTWSTQVSVSERDWKWLPSTMNVFITFSISDVMTWLHESQFSAYIAGCTNTLPSNGSSVFTTWMLCWSCLMYGLTDFGCIVKKKQ